MDASAESDLPVKGATTEVSVDPRPTGVWRGCPQACARFQKYGRLARFKIMAFHDRHIGLRDLGGGLYAPPNRSRTPSSRSSAASRSSRYLYPPGRGPTPRVVMSTSFASSKKSWLEKRPLVRTALFTDLQNGSYIASIYTLVQSIFMVVLTIFDVYCLAEAEPGSTHYRYFGISFLFVYSGNFHVRNLLLFCSVVSFVLAMYVLIASAILMRALRREQEAKFQHWLISTAAFTIWRFLAIIYRSIVNDLYFAYHQAMLIIWILLIGVNVFFWLVVYSNYQELVDITRLEDMAKLKMGTMSSLNTTHNLSQSHHSMDSMKNTAPQLTSSPRGSASTASV